MIKPSNRPFAYKPLHFKTSFVFQIQVLLVCSTAGEESWFKYLILLVERLISFCY